MGNAPSRLCSINSPPPSPQPSPPPTPAQSFSQRPFLLSTDPPTLCSLPSSSSSLGLAGSLRTRAPSLRVRPNSQAGRLLLPSLSLNRRRSVSEKRLSPNSEQLIAQEFGISPGSTKLVSLLPSGEGDRASSPQDTVSEANWTLGGQIPSPGLYVGEQLGLGGSVRMVGKPRRWSLQDLTSSSSRRRAQDGRRADEEDRILPNEASTSRVDGKPTRPLIPPRSSSLTELEKSFGEMEQQNV